MYILNSDEVTRALPMDEAVRAMKKAFIAISDETANLPLRTHVDIASHSGTTLIMPAYIEKPDEEALTVKVVSVFGNNPAQHAMPRIQAAVLVLDPETGQASAVLEGSSLTGIRTAAASGAATDVLSRSDSISLAVLGAGVQARSHIAAMMAVRPIQVVKVWSRTRERVDELVNELRQNEPACQFLAVDSADEAVEDVDIVCTVTTASEPLFDAKRIRKGTHLNVVGSYQPHVREVPTDTVVAASVFVDEVASALAEAGDLIQPIREGRINESHVLGTIGDVLLGRIAGRQSDDEVTLFKSVGNAAEDALAASAVLRNARQQGLGTAVDF